MMGMELGETRDVKLQAWGVETAGRCHSVFLVCPIHARHVQARAMADMAGGSTVRSVRLEQLDAAFASIPTHCAFCPGTWPGEARPSELTQEWAHTTTPPDQGALH